MNIRKGFQVENPDYFVSWEVTEADLVANLGAMGLRKIKNGCYCLPCISLGGLKHELGFIFNVRDMQAEVELDCFAHSVGTVNRTITAPGYGKRRAGKLVKLQFFGADGADVSLSFDKIQYHFEKNFGKPTNYRMDEAGYPYYEWRPWGVRIYHYRHDRFGLEEIALIVKS